MTRVRATSVLEGVSDQSPAALCFFSRDEFKRKVSNPGPPNLMVSPLPFPLLQSGPTNLLGHLIFLFPLWSFFLSVWGQTFYSSAVRPCMGSGKWTEGQSKTLKCLRTSNSVFRRVTFNTLSENDGLQTLRARTLYSQNSRIPRSFCLCGLCLSTFTLLEILKKWKTPEYTSRHQRNVSPQILENSSICL